ncbi:MAG: glycosyltransferase, partial [Verrucomicrobiota bacterium]
LEGADFWHGISLTAHGEGWLEHADVVVLPAFVENCPRILLRAIAAGKPVIATEACGIGDLPGVTVIPTGDSTKLRSILMEHLLICQNDVSSG